jgi:hypothetical protein
MGRPVLASNKRQRVGASSSLCEDSMLLRANRCSQFLLKSFTKYVQYPERKKVGASDGRLCPEHMRLCNHLALRSSAEGSHAHRCRLGGWKLKGVLSGRCHFGSPPPTPLVWPPPKPTRSDSDSIHSSSVISADILTPSTSPLSQDVIHESHTGWKVSVSR